MTTSRDAATTPDTGHRGEPAYLTARAAAARLNVNERTIRRAIARGELAAVKRHGVFHIDLAALDRWRAHRAPSVVSPGRVQPSPRLAATLLEPATPLIGRDRERAMAVSLLRRDDVRLLTLTGAGGIGKTRLALAVASQLAPDYADGAHVVPLAEIADASRVATAIAERLHVPGGGDVGARDALVAGLRDAHMLLVLDNFEHVIAAAPLVSELLAACPRIRIVVSSRALLRIGGEQALPVPPLDLPDTMLASEHQPATSPAEELFLARARAVAPSFAPTTANTAAIRAICQRMGGLPLAIELAASQVTVLPPDALLARIDAMLPLPVDGPRDAPDRQRTVENAIDWSYALLPARARWLFRYLGVFAGGFSLDAVQALCEMPAFGSPGTMAAQDPLATLAALVDASLVHRVGDDGARYAMLEPIRAFALERLTEDGALEPAQDMLAEWCLALAERNPMAASLPGGEHHLARLTVERANVARAIVWLDQRGDADRLLRLAVAIGPFWYERNHYREGHRWLERALAAGGCGDAALRAWAAIQYGLFVGILGDPARARDIAAGGVATLREGAEPGLLATALIWQGAIAIQDRDEVAAERALTEALTLAATIPDAALAGSISARAMSNLGASAHAGGRLDDAARWHRQALATCREHGYLLGTTRALCDLGDVARDRGDHAAALVSYREGMMVLGERGDLRAVVAALEGAAMACATWDQGEQAARLLGTAAGLAAEHGIPSIFPTDRAARDRAIRVVREMVGAPRFDTLFAEGRRVSLPEAIAAVLAVAPPSGAAGVPAPGADTLTPREREVLRLLAAGRRDREIADSLFISVRTVEGHVARILGKLQVPTRVAAARAAIDLGIADDER